MMRTSSVGRWIPRAFIRLIGIILIFGLFSWTKMLIVLLIAGSMFWGPVFLAAAIFGLSVMQAKPMDPMDA